MFVTPFILNGTEVYAQQESPAPILIEAEIDEEMEKMRDLYTRYLNGEITTVDDEVRAAIEFFETVPEMPQSPFLAPLNQSSVIVELDGDLILEGAELDLAFENVSGILTTVIPDFVLITGGEAGVWSSDFALLFYQSDDVNEDFEPTGAPFLQIGGFSNLGATTRIQWTDGSSSAPVTQTLDISPGIEMNDVVVFRANGWSNTASWEGEIELVGIADTEDDFSVQSLSLNRFMNQAGNPAQASVVVRNEGSLAQSKEIEFLIDNELIGTRTTQVLERGESQTVSFSWTPDTPLLGQFQVRLPEDENLDNNTANRPIAVVDNTQLAQNFEGNLLAPGWSNPGGWQQSIIGFFSEALILNQTRSAFASGNSEESPRRLITAPVELDGSWETFSFWRKGFNNSAGAGFSTLRVLYQDIDNAGNWIELSEISFENDDAPQLESISLRNIPDGVYRFAFEASSTFDDPFADIPFSAVVIDDVIGPEVTLQVLSDFPFHETFESDSQSRVLWEQVFVEGNVSWDFRDGAVGGAVSSARSGIRNARINTTESGSITRLISPIFDYSSLNNPVLSFWYANEAIGGLFHNLIVYYRTEA
ncbi:MAG: hypothetical protein LAT67_15550, partial [Balneolales bacterium]|nr:hypothetical protein [Balneolales bacterium]